MSKCPDCNCTNLTHLHNEVHGIAGTHMSGSERYECECGKIIYCNEGEPLGFRFIIDGSQEIEVKK